MPHTYQIIDDDDFDLQDELRPEYDFAALRLSSSESKLQTVRSAMRDPLFIEDLQEVAEDFKHIDTDEVGL